MNDDDEDEANAGGAATAGGVDFQALVAALMAVQVLAEKGGPARWGLPAGVTIEGLRAEGTAAVDDLSLSTSVFGRIFIQAKTTVPVSDKPGSVLGSVIDQFVRLFLGAQSTTPLDADIDRIVLATRPTGPLDHLAAVLDRIRSLGTPGRWEDCATNEGEKSTISKALTLVKHFWRVEKGAEPTWDEMVPLLKLIWVSRFQLDADQSDALVAKILLRNAILEDADQDEVAWSALRTRSIELAKRRSGANRPELQRVLAQEGVVLKALRGFESDISELRGHTRRSLRTLTRYTRIRKDVRIPRDVAPVLRAEVEKASLLLIGDAGCGKSGLLGVTVETLLRENRDVLVLNAAELGANSLGNLSNELRLRHDLLDVLEQWQGATPAFVVIDALDSARDERTQLMLRNLIEHVQDLHGRWHVVATIRKFDLKHGRAWQALMPGTGIRPHFDPAFDHVRHLNVEKLTAGELMSLEHEDPDLHKLIVAAPVTVADLVRVPFNLMLVTELLTADAAADLALVTTQLQLLDLYWSRRVGIGLGGASREATLRDVTDEMVKTRRLEAVAAIAPDKAALEGLQRDAVLFERAGTVHFGHHILFDYAVERLLLRPDSEVSIARLETDRDLSISIGPSLKYWLEGHWERDSTRRGFWKVALQLASSSAPSIAKIICGAVAAANTHLLSDVRELIDNVGRVEGARLFVFAADAVTADIRRVASEVPCPWFHIIAEVCELATPPVVHRASYLLHELLNAREPTSAELSHAGRAARRMLTVAWATTPRFVHSVVQGLRAVGRTFESNAAESTALLQRALAPDHITRFGHEELRWLGDEVLHFVDSPEFLARLYGTTFAAAASAEKTTAMSSSRIFGLTSNAKQDLQGAQYVLAKNFPRIADVDIALAIEIAIVVADGYVSRERTAHQHIELVKFPFLGAEYEFAPDSMSWHSPYAEEPKIVNAAASRLAGLAGDDPSRATEILRIVAAKSATAWLWRTLIQEAATSSELLGLLKEMIFAPSLMRIFSKEFATWLTRQPEAFSPEQRRQLDAVALSIRDGYLGEVAAARILSAIGDDLSPEAAEWVSERERPISDRSGWSPEPVADPDNDSDDDEKLAAQGISALEVRSRANLALKAASRIASERSRREHVNVEEERVGLAELRGLVDGEGLHDVYVAAAWGVIAEGASRLALAGRDDVSQLLLEAALRPEPALDVDAESHFASSPSWVPNQARIEAVDGLTALATRSDDPDVLSAVQALAVDPVAAVRFQVARNAHRIAKRHAKAFLDLAELLILDSNDAVAIGAFHKAVHEFFLLDASRGTAVLLRARAAFASRGTALREVLFVEMLSQYIATGDVELAEVVDAAADNPGEDSTQLERAVMSVRALLTYSKSHPYDADAVRFRSIGFVRRVVVGATTWFDALVGRPSLDDSERKVVGAAAKSLAHVAQELYFASFAHDVREGRVVDVDVRRRFYSEMRDIFELLSRSGIPAAVHYLVETLATFIDLAEPQDVFLLVGAAVRAGKRGGYQYESLAVKEVVAIVERYLADFRAIFVDSEECRAALRDILDTFVDAGWAETHRLVYALDSIFR
ncbi:MAG: hypothetical protein K8W52_15395 [Deltaproteobacteria bacterium]|nr:hypothetical protein [Deltaproteobacteria bacterium]